MNIKKKDKDIVLQYVKTVFTKVEENLETKNLLTQMTPFVIRRKIFPLFINNELLEPFFLTMKDSKMK